MRCQTEALLEAAFQRGESPAQQTRQLLRLLDEYGADELRAAMAEALERGTPRASSVAFLLKKRRRLRADPGPRPVDLSRRPELEDVHVQPHDPESYDDLSD